MRAKLCTLLAAPKRMLELRLKNSALRNLERLMTSGEEATLERLCMTTTQGEGVILSPFSCLKALTLRSVNLRNTSTGPNMRNLAASLTYLSIDQCWHDEEFLENLGHASLGRSQLEYLFVQFVSFNVPIQGRDCLGILCSACSKLKILHLNLTHRQNHVTTLQAIARLGTSLVSFSFGTSMLNIDDLHRICSSYPNLQQLGYTTTGDDLIVPLEWAHQRSARKGLTRDCQRFARELASISVWARSIAFASCLLFGRCSSCLRPQDSSLTS
jgi:hypothetical protein